ncbi:MAG TPA: helix-turn-helix domain-containing protein [Bellilinea sp.]|nr:helix-turn-helix domain-containing protein [Bellilinea sp.]
MDNQTKPTVTPKLLRANDVAQQLSISRSLAYQLMQRGEIPTVRFGSSVRVRECDLEEYLNRHWSGWN